MNEYMKRYFTMNEHDRLIYDCRKYKEKEIIEEAAKKAFSGGFYDYENAKTYNCEWEPINCKC